MRISVVIPTLNEASHIQGAIESAWKANVDEVIVADGSSQDDTVELARHANASVVSCSMGRGIQLNQGVADSDGDVLLFLHADCRLHEDSASQIRNAIEQRKADWGGFKQSIDDSRWRFRWMELGNFLRARVRRLVYGDQGIWVRREVFDKVGRFPDYPLMEDVALCDRLRKHRMNILPGPLNVDPRRWNKTSITRQTIKNYYLFTAYRLGVSPERLNEIYRGSKSSSSKKP